MRWGGAATSRRTTDAITFYGNSISDPLGNILAQAPRDEPAVLVAELDFARRAQWAELFPFFRCRQLQTYGARVTR